MILYTPFDSERLKLGTDPYVCGRISKVLPSGAVILHLDLVGVMGCIGYTAGGLAVQGPITTSVIEDARHDPDGEPGTWCFPPRV